jgi:hypothetical protein
MFMLVTNPASWHASCIMYDLSPGLTVQYNVDVLLYDGQRG